MVVSAGANHGHLATRTLSDLLQTSSDPATRLLAARHLADQPNGAARQALRSALDDVEPEVRSAAEEGLRRITMAAGGVDRHR